MSDSATTLVVPALDQSGPPRTTSSPELAVGRRRFTVAVLVGIGIVSLPYFWILWDSWTGQLNPLRSLNEGNFYDIQGRAMLAGHLYVPTGSLSIEAFVNGGRQYAYFGLFPSIIRLPILLVTHSLDGQLTGLSMGAAWAAAGGFAALLLWRVRILIRGDAAVGWVEAGCSGLLVATITGGSVMMYLAATPRAFQEELVWSVALTLGVLFALLGIMEHPTRRRIVACGALVFAAAMTRGSTGYACVLGSVLVGIWLASGRAGEAERRWAIPTVATGLLPLLVMVILNYVKFGQLFGFNEADQVWTLLSVQRQHFLAANNGSAFGLQFLPTAAATYVRPWGLHISAVFPYLTLPTTPARIIGHVTFDEVDTTTSIPASMPLLFVLGLWGCVTAFRPRTPGRTSLLRIPMLTAAAGGGAVLLFGYIANRYLADFLPFFALAAMVGLVDVCRRMESFGRAGRRVMIGAIAFIACVEIVANIGIAVSPTGGWTAVQATNFVKAQHAVSGSALTAQTVHIATLPTAAVTGTLADVGGCKGLYLSTGALVDAQPEWLTEHLAWIPIEQSPSVNRVLRVQFNRPVKPGDRAIVLFRYGTSALAFRPTGLNSIQLFVYNPAPPGNWPPPVSDFANIRVHVPYDFQVMVDPILDRMVVSGLGVGIGPVVAGAGALAVPGDGSGQTVPPAVTITDVTPKSPGVTLCRSLGGR